MIDKALAVTHLTKQGLSVDEATAIADKIERLEYQSRPPTVGELATTAAELTAAATAERRKVEELLSEHTVAVVKRIGEAEARLGSQIASSKQNAEEMDATGDAMTGIERRPTRWMIAAAVAATCAAAAISRVVVELAAAGAQQLLR